MRKYVIVTGSSRGIGRALVQTYLEEGFKVIGLSRSESKAESYAENFHWLKTDLAQPTNIL